MVIMLVFNLFPASSLAVHRSQQDLQAASLAEGALEAMRAEPFEELTVGARDPELVEQDGLVYSLNRQVLKVDGPSPERLLGLRVTVRWEERGKRHQLVQEAHVARFPR